MAKNRPKQLGIMKATPAEAKNIGRLGTYCFAQPKLRGQRARTVWIGDQPILLSSYGNAFSFMEHITEQLKCLPRKNYDGELYLHDPEWTQPKINSVCNRSTNRHPEGYKIQYHIFDLATEGTQRERFDELMCISYKYKTLPCIQWVTTDKIHTVNWKIWCKLYLEEGYEGIILRHLTSPYSPLTTLEEAKRPRWILKYKPSEKDSYTIVGFKPGIEDGWTAGMLGSFLVQSPEGGEAFYVGTGPELTKAKRTRYWAERHSLLGKTLVVKHEPVETGTGKGIPICTSAFRLEVEE